MAARLDPVDDPPAPIGHEQAAARVDQQCQRVAESRGEGADAPGAAVRSQLHTYDPAPEAVAQVLTPLGERYPGWVWASAIPPSTPEREPSLGKVT